jgi:hypothetical protein
LWRDLRFQAPLALKGQQRQLPLGKDNGKKGEIKKEEKAGKRSIGRRPLLSFLLSISPFLFSSLSFLLTAAVFGK